MLPLFSVVLDGILFILTGNDGIHKSLDEFEIRPDPTKDHIVSCPLASEKLMFPFFSLCINPIHFKFVGIEDLRNI